MECLYSPEVTPGLSALRDDLPPPAPLSENDNIPNLIATFESSYGEDDTWLSKGEKPEDNFNCVASEDNMSKCNSTEPLYVGAMIEECATPATKAVSDIRIELYDSDAMKHMS